MDSGRRPRLCHLFKWTSFDGYGFNLHAEKHKTGHYIGHIEEESPAALAGLLESDRVIEVNGKSVVNYTHAQVVNSIKENPDEAKLLVVDQVTDQYFEEENIPINGELKNILYIKADKPKRESIININNPSGDTINTANQDTTNVNINANKNLPNINAKKSLSKSLTIPRNQAATFVKCSLITDRNFKGYGFDLRDAPPHQPKNKASTSSKSPTDNGEQSSLSGAGRSFIILEDASRALDDQPGLGTPFEGKHFVGSVDSGSPAEKAGLKAGDALYKVNDTPVQDYTHDKVVQMIKADPERVTLLVARKMSSTPSSTPTSDSHSLKNGISNSREKDDLINKSNVFLATKGATHPSPNNFGRKPDDTNKMNGNSNSRINSLEVPKMIGIEEFGHDKLPEVKLCHLKKWPNFDGYGFNLHAGKTEVQQGPDGKPVEKIGHFIGNVDPKSPAQAAGLVPGDRVIEVDQVNVEDMNHKEVVNLIKTDPENTCLLVVNEKDYEYFTVNKIPINARSENVVEMYSSPRSTFDKKNANQEASPIIKDVASVNHESRPIVDQRNNDEEGDEILNVAAERTPDWIQGDGSNGLVHVDRIPIEQSPDYGRLIGGRHDVSDSKMESSFYKRMSEKLSPDDNSSYKSTFTNGDRSPSSQKDSWNMSANEIKAKLANESRRKKDLKSDSRTLKEKYEILQKM
ncbi:unnamed protein product [Gordionus sp. m RMFG-2023]|uniref:Na(+)/H(+) exchange regulatory cofactor NHE-RF3-like n=1 Tax=Gordionus sp. m RMFG-2023 TaxID=3053472 RepID=UPI0030DF5C88